MTGDGGRRAPRGRRAWLRLLCVPRHRARRAAPGAARPGGTRPTPAAPAAPAHRPGRGPRVPTRSGRSRRWTTGWPGRAPPPRAGRGAGRPAAHRVRASTPTARSSSPRRSPGASPRGRSGTASCATSRSGRATRTARPSTATTSSPASRSPRRRAHRPTSRSPTSGRSGRSASAARRRRSRGTADYVVRYRLAHVVNDIGDGTAEFYYNVVDPSNGFPQLDVSATVTGPAPATRAACFYGELGSTTPCEAHGRRDLAPSPCPTSRPSRARACSPPTPATPSAT